MKKVVFGTGVVLAALFVFASVISSKSINNEDSAAETRRPAVLHATEAPPAVSTLHTTERPASSSESSCPIDPSTLQDGRVASFEGRHIYTMKVNEDSPGDAVAKVCGIPIEPIDIRANAKVGHVVIKNIKFLYHSVRETLEPTAKRVWLDLGARVFPGSTGYFMKYYPDAPKFEAHVFELLDLKQGYGHAESFFRGGFTYHQAAAWTHGNGVTIRGKKMAKVSDGIESIKNDKRQEWKAPSIDVGALLKARYTRADFVVLKIDIEGGEWTLIPHLIKTGAMELIDEVFFECHPLDFGDYGKAPGRMPQICVDFINDLRVRGYYAHRWI